MRLLEHPSIFEVTRALTYGERRLMILEAVRDHDLRAFALKVLIELDAYYNAKSGLAWPSQQRIAQDLGRPGEPVAIRAIERAIAELIERGYVQVVKRGRSNRYRLARPLFEHHPDVEPIEEDAGQYPTPVSGIGDEHPTCVSGVMQAIPDTHVGSYPTPVSDESPTPVSGRTGNRNRRSEPVSQPTTAARPPADEAPPKPKSSSRKSTPKASATAATEPAQPNGGVRYAAVIDAIRAQGVPYEPCSRDAGAVKRSSAAPELLAEAFCALYRGEWGGRVGAEHVALWYAADRLGAYQASLQRPAASVGPNPRLGPSRREALDFADDWLEPPASS